MGFLRIILAISVSSLVVAALLARQVLRADTGTPRMEEISNAIKEGAEVFLRRQYKTIYLISGVVALVLLLLYLKSDFTMAWKIMVGFLTGAICSGLAGFIGMFVSIRANIRTASAAQTSLNRALQLALRGGAVSGLSVVAMSLLGVGILFYFYGGLNDPTHVPDQIVGFGFGASLVALFAQLGGGIYTKAADVGADLVGKVEAGIPEDDPRNPAVIADLVGDNVGDCAGRGADLFESTAAENIGAMVLGVALYAVASSAGWPHPEAWIFFPLVVRAFGLLSTIVAIFFVRGREDENPMNMLNRGYWVTTILSVFALLFTTNVMMQTTGTAPSGLPVWLYFFAAGVVGLATSVAFVYITQYYTAGT